MSKNPKLAVIAAALPFAHLLGLGPRAENDDSKQREGESDEDYAKRMEQEDKKQRDGESDEDYAKRMEEEDKKQREGESDEDYAKRMAAEDDDEDEESDDSEKEKAARKAERARCAAIFSSSAAGVRPDVAAHLAFSTDMSSADAIAMLTTVAGGKATTHSLRSRMSSVVNPNPGASAPGGAAPNSAAAVASQIIEAGKKARGEK